MKQKNGRFKKISWAMIGMITIILLIFAILNMFCNHEVQGYTYTDSSNLTWYFTISGGKAYNLYLQSGTVSEDTLTIPSTVTYGGTSYQVVAIRGYGTSTGTSNSYRQNMLYFPIKSVTNYRTNIKTIIIPEGVTTIGNNTFANMRGVTNIVIPDSVTSIGSYAFYNCNAATSINIGDGVTSIGTYAFSGCSNVETLNLGAKVQTISDYAFSDCRKITGELAIPQTTTQIGNYTFSNCSGFTSLNLGTTVKTIGASAFSSCTGLTGTITVPSTTTTIGSSAFSNCSGIAGVNIGSGVTSLSDSLFSNCKNLTNIIAVSATSIGNNTFYGSGIAGEFTVPELVRTIGNNAFANCAKLTQINIGRQVTSISTTAFNYDMALTNINVDSGNTIYSSIDGILFNKNQTSIILCPLGNEKVNYVIPGTVTSIEASAFNNCQKISGTITFPETLQTIGANAFYNCTKLTGKLEIPDSVTILNNSTFSNCIGFTELKLPDNLETIGSSVFSNCTGFTGDLIIPDTVTSIGASAFSNCTKFDGTLKIGNGLTTINSNVFQNCSNFYKAILGNGITSIGYCAFQGFSNIWIEKEEGTVDFNTYYSGTELNAKIHWIGCTHKIEISTLPGIKIINADTLEEITSGDYNCETSFNYKIQVDDGYNYSNLKLIKIFNNNSGVDSSEDVNIGTVYQINRLLDNCKIYVQNISTTTNFDIKTFVIQKNRTDIAVTREPSIIIKNGEINYESEETPLLVKAGDLLTCRVRVYNKGILTGKPGEISIEIPKGLEYVKDNRTNTVYGWREISNGKLASSYLKNTKIGGYDGIKNLEYVDIDIMLKVSSEAQENETAIYEYVAKLGEKEDKESITLSGQIKVDYTIKLNKIDADTKELLKGAEFEMKDVAGNIIGTSTTDESGTLDFGLITTYGAGQDVYYIEETGSPEGYMLVERTKIKVIVTKTIVDEEQGTYAVAVTCEVLDYNTDTKRYEYTPIKTREQLEKIGSGEKITIDGVEYEYNINTNYKLMNDIDLAGEEWVPISHRVKGIIDGNGHKISNLTISSQDEYGLTEVGLFRSFSGIIENLTLENVNININAISEDALTISNHPCVGGFAGYMVEGTIRNCTVSGNISAITDNIGGFVGHTAEEYIVKMQNCTNNANITGAEGTAMKEGVETTVKSSNVGGLIGCALGALSITDCNNTGVIKNTNYNVGGIVGFVKSTNYQEVNITADFDEADKVIELVVENKKTTGKYDIIIENLDAKTLGLIEGAVYTVLDKNQKVLNGFENIQLVDGRLKVATVDINSLGVDTYYIKEVKPAYGYEGLLGYVKLEVSRYWDKEAQAFKVAVNTDVLSNKEIVTDEPTVIDTPITSTTGNIFTKVTFENVTWNVNKAEIKNCTNSGIVITSGMNAAGILGTTYSIVEIDNCENTATIVSTSADTLKKNSTSTGKAGGIVSEIRTDGLNKFCLITNCDNSGNVLSEIGYGAAGGIVAHNIGQIEFQNCTNSGEVSGYCAGTGGILGDLNGNLIAKNCKNSGQISNPIYNVNSTCGGILGKNYVYSEQDKEKNSIYIDTCENTGEINGGCHSGGIIGMEMSPVITVKNCVVKDTTLIDKEGDKGGVVGFLHSNDIEIDNCVIENVEFAKDSTYVSQYYYSTYGATGGIIGNLCKYGGYNYATFENTCISNCTVKDSSIISKANQAAGILGMANGINGQTKVNIFDCVVEDTQIKNNESIGTYSNAAGIFAAAYECGDIAIDNCLVNNCDIATVVKEGGQTSDANDSGIMGIGFYCRTFTAKRCEVIDSNITNNGTSTDTCANAAGIVAGIGVDSSAENSFSIDKCNVTNTNITTVAGNLGGIAGLYYEFDNSNEHLITNCTVTGGTFTSTADTSSNTCTGGIGGMMSGKIKVQNCIVDGTTIVGNGRNIAGQIAVGYYDTTMENCTVKNADIENTGETTYSSPTSSCDCVAGLVGYIGGNNSIFTDITIENTNITGNKLIANTSGICGATNSSNTAKFVRCNVINSVITSTTQYVQNLTNGTSSGICGRTNGNNTVLDQCSVKGTQISGKGSLIGGMIASCNAFTATNCDIEDLEIIDNTEIFYIENVYRALGGIIASATGMDSTVNNCNVDGLTVTSKMRSAGGIVGSAQSIKQIKDCTVNDFHITGESSNNINYGSIGGFVGDATQIALIDNCKIQNSGLTGNSENIAGIIGTTNNGLQINKAIVDNVKLINNNKYNSQKANIGGIIATTIGDTNLTNSNVINSELNVKSGASSSYHVGGLAGYSYNIDIVNSVVEDSKIINNTSDGNVGGLVGMTEYLDGTTPRCTTLTLTNSGIKNTDVSGMSKIGGIIGFGKLESISGYTNSSNIVGISTYGEIGGAIGNGLPESNINNFDVTNSNIKLGMKSGGIAGFAPMNITECDVNGTTITAGTQYGDIGGIAGTASNSSSEISKCNITNCTISNPTSGYTGGIAGFANNTISECNVTNCIIEATTTLANSLGGIVGQGSNFTGTSTYIYKCIVSACKLSGIQRIGGIAGAAVPNIEESKVTGTISYETPAEENEEETVEVYTSTITGTDSIGGIIGDAGQISTGYQSTNLTNCTIENTSITGKTNISESIGKNSRYTSTDTTIYDVITNLIKSNCKLIIEE